MTICDSLRTLLGEDRIGIVDVGAAGGLAKRWHPVAGALRVVAFEPDSRSITTTDSRSGAEVTTVPKAAGATTGPATLYLARKPRCSSLREPNFEVVRRYPDPERYDVVGTAQVECTTIDAALPPIGTTMDFLKIDTQGTELDVLSGARDSLQDCLGLEIEVEFQQLYAGASVFRDIDAYVSDLGFELFDLRRTFFTRARLDDTPQAKGQIIFGDALYFRPWKQVLDRSRLLRLAILLLTYGLADVVLEMVSEAEPLEPQDRQALKELVRRLSRVPGTDADRKDRFVGSGLQLT